MLNGNWLPIRGEIIGEPTNLCMRGILLQYSTYKSEDSLLPCKTEQLFDGIILDINPYFGYKSNFGYGGHGSHGECGGNNDYCRHDVHRGVMDIMNIVDMVGIT